MKKSELRQIIREELLKESTLASAKKDAEKYKKDLVQQYKSKGPIKNWGKKEIKKLNDKYSDSTESGVADILNAFEDWANYSNTYINN